MRELFNGPHEWVDPPTKQLIDFIRVHSTIHRPVDLAWARKIAVLAEWFDACSAGLGRILALGAGICLFDVSEKEVKVTAGCVRFWRRRWLVRHTERRAPLQFDFELGAGFAAL
ncbi:MAG: hypothetical protein M2R45_04319 [Verrucomicrobia subdivision 3 bacterium]|nr:hypothetical protein [Limisphaerales bacterium]MCS1417234.1 hypothetical protein [Limisphaerales bacterium]